MVSSSRREVGRRQDRRSLDSRSGRKSLSTQHDNNARRSILPIRSLGELGARVHSRPQTVHVTELGPVLQSGSRPQIVPRLKSDAFMRLRLWIASRRRRFTKSPTRWQTA